MDSTKKVLAFHEKATIGKKQKGNKIGLECVARL